MEIDRPHLGFKFNTKRKQKKPVEQRPDDSQEINVDERYEVRCGKPPVAFVFNNNKFKTLTERTGSEKDVNNLQLILEELGFNVNIFQDCTGSEMKCKLLNASKKEYAGTNYFFCALCSHGDDGVIFGTDGDAQAYEKDPDQDHESWLKLSVIFDMFSGANCKSLVGKPKMFVIQACRGETLQEPELQMDISRYATVADVGVKPTIPSEADFVIAYATSEGNCAVRDTDYGTWFIQDFKKVFQGYGTQKEYQHLLTVVNKLVSNREVPEDIVKRLGLKGSKQMPCFLSKLTKQLYLTSNSKGF